MAVKKPETNKQKTIPNLHKCDYRSHTSFVWILTLSAAEDGSQGSAEIGRMLKEV